MTNYGDRFAPSILSFLKMDPSTLSLEPEALDGLHTSIQHSKVNFHSFGSTTKQFPPKHPPGEVVNMFVTTFFQLISNHG